MKHAIDNPWTKLLLKRRRVVADNDRRRMVADDNTSQTKESKAPAETQMSSAPLCESASSLSVLLPLNRVTATSIDYLDQIDTGMIARLNLVYAAPVTAPELPPDFKCALYEMLPTILKWWYHPMVLRNHRIHGNASTIQIYERFIGGFKDALPRDLHRLIIEYIPDGCNDLLIQQMSTYFIKRVETSLKSTDAEKVVGSTSYANWQMYHCSQSERFARFVTYPRRPLAPLERDEVTHCRRDAVIITTCDQTTNNSVGFGELLPSTMYLSSMELRGPVDTLFYEEFRNSAGKLHSSDHHFATFGVFQPPSPYHMVHETGEGDWINHHDSQAFYPYRSDSVGDKHYEIWCYHNKVDVQPAGHNFYYQDSDSSSHGYSICHHFGWYNDGTCHRSDGPALVTNQLYVNKDLKSQPYQMVDEIKTFGIERLVVYMNNGLVHRTDGPAVVSRVPYRDDAIQYTDIREFWRRRLPDATLSIYAEFGAYHREQKEGPAIGITYGDGSLFHYQYYLNGKRHRGREKNLVLPPAYYLVDLLRSSSSLSDTASSPPRSKSLYYLHNVPVDKMGNWCLSSRRPNTRVSFSSWRYLTSLDLKLLIGIDNIERGRYV